MVHTIVSIVGIHTSGKTTILEFINSLGLKTEEEIAEKLRIDFNLKAGASGDINFDKLVKEKEIERDNNRKWDNKHIFIESWHILTMAYMLTRGVALQDLREYIQYINILNNSFNLECIYLKLDSKSLLNRSSRLHYCDINNYIDFYDLLNKNILNILSNLNMNFYTFNTNFGLKECENFIKKNYLTMEEQND